MKKLLSVILTIITMAWIIYVPDNISVTLAPNLAGWAGQPDKTEGAAWYVVTSVAYYIANWVTGLTLVGMTVIALGVASLVVKLAYHVAQEIYHTVFAFLGWVALILMRVKRRLLEAMEVKK